MELQIIESISKHAVTLVLVIGILMLTDKGIMLTGIIAMLLLTGGIIGFLFRALLLIVRIAFIFFIVGQVHVYLLLLSCRQYGHRVNISDRSKNVCPIQLMSLKTSATIWNLCVIFPAILTERMS